jgi:hypothetical protein
VSSDRIASVSWEVQIRYAGIGVDVNRAGGASIRLEKAVDWDAGGIRIGVATRFNLQRDSSQVEELLAGSERLRKTSGAVVAAQHKAPCNIRFHGTHVESV